MLFSNRAETLKAIVELVFEWSDPASESWQNFATKEPSLSGSPAWARYLKRQCSPTWKEFSESERERAFAGLASFFSPSIDGTDRDLNARFFRAFETQGASPFERNGKPGFLRLLHTGLRFDSWTDLIVAMGRVLPAEQSQAKYDRQYAGSATAPFYRQIAGTETGKHLLAALEEAPIGGGQQWQTLWRMLRACAFLAEYGDFETFLNKSGVFEMLQTDLPVDSPANFLTEWKRREQLLAKISAPLPGLGANTLQYVLRDLDYPGCLSLFKLDSTNRKMFTLLFGQAIGDSREKVVEALVRLGVLRSYPLAVVNVACYVFTAENHLNLFGSLKRVSEGRFELTLPSTLLSARI